ncbi:MAG TPA: PGF-pre-PGF domain-containing protein, partial [Candidatus Nanoarchaeia archaeon]|nr:PGF-pre-PGF domain-containing protein [Candidatus Nanoarchaeia archaeon]
ATVKFDVEKSWLSRSKVEPGNIALYRYGSSGWGELPTTKTAEDATFVHYEAKTPGLSVFAIAVKSEESIEKINNEIQGFETAQPIQSAYSISGIIVKSDKKNQVEKGTHFTIQNLNTSEIVEGKTGMGPSSPPGAFFIIVPGKIGHSLKITISGGGRDSENRKAEGTMTIEGDVDGFVLVADYKRGKASALNQGQGSKITGFIVLNDMFTGKDKSRILFAMAILAAVAIITALIIKARRQKKKKSPLFALSFFAIVLLLALAQRISAPPPSPHSVAGYIFESDGITQVAFGTSFSINDSGSGDFFRSKTSIPVPGLTGRYFETVNGSDGDFIRVMAWNSTHYGNTSVTLVGDMDGINVTLNLSRSPEANVSILVPANNTAYNIGTYFNATANISAVGATATGCNATISFGDLSVLNISGMDSLNHSLGSIQLGQAVATSWNISAQGAINTTLTVTAKCENEAVSLESQSRATASNITVTDSQGPLVSLVSPENNTLSGANTVVFNYNVSDPSRISNCTLAINDLLNVSNGTAVLKSAVQNITQSLENGQYNWTVRCQDIAGNVGNGTNFNLTVNATVPVLTNLKLTSPVNLQAGASATAWCNATITVNRELVNISRVNATFFDQQVALFNSPDDNNDHYTNASCTNLTAAADSTDYGCAFPVWYYANNASWQCRLTATDTNNASGFTTSATTINELVAMGAGGILDFGLLAPTNTSNDTNLTLFNQGNKNINISVRGYGILQAGDNLSMSCGPDGNISVESERYSVTPSVGYDNMRNLTNQSSLVLNFTLFQKTNDAQNGSEVNQTFWRIKAPTGVGGACNGTTVVLASIA